MFRADTNQGLGIEVKTNGSKLTDNQEELKKNTKIGLKVFRITAEFPETFEVTQE